MLPTPGSLVPGSDIRLELQMLATIISAAVYGIVFSLSTTCFRLLLRRCRQHPDPRKMQYFLPFYVVAMAFLSTFSLVEAILSIQKCVFQPRQSNYSPVCIGGGGRGFASMIPPPLGIGVVCIPLAIWGADGFMLWRLTVLYQDLRGGRRFTFIALLIFLSLVSIASGILLIAFFGNFIFVLSTAAVTAIVNIIFTGLIAIPLIVQQKRAKAIFGEEVESPYKRIISICVESCALIVVTNITFVALFFQQANGSAIPQVLLIHASVISPLLIIYRVAKGRDSLTTMATYDSELENSNQGGRGQQLASIRFHRSQILSTDSSANQPYA